MKNIPFTDIGSAADRRLGWLLLLLLIEGLALGLSFDGSSLGGLPHGWWTPILRLAGRAMPVGAAVLTAVALVSWPSLRKLALASEATAGRHSHVPLLAVHLAAVAILWVVSTCLFAPGPTVLRHPVWWVDMWFLSVAAVGASWLAAALPSRVTGLGAPRLIVMLVPALILGLGAYAAGRYTQGGWTSLRTPTLLSAGFLLKTFDPSTQVDPSQFVIGAGDFIVEIDAECSGYESIGLAIVFLGTFFVAFRRELRFPRVFLLLPAIVIAVWLANVVRIALLVAIGAHVSDRVALGGFHSFAGVLLFCAIALGTAALARRSPYFAKDIPPRVSGEATANPAAPFLLPLLVGLLTALVAGLFSGSVRWEPFYPVRVVAVAIALWLLRHRLRILEWNASVAAILIGAATFFAWIILCRNSKPAPAPEELGMPQPWRALWAVSRVLGAVITVPIAEELAFRGYLSRRLMGADFETVQLRQVAWPAIALAAVASAALHTHFLAGTVAGLAYGWAAKRRGRLADAVVAHATTNALVVAYVLATADWRIW